MSMALENVKSRTTYAVTGSKENYLASCVYRAAETLQQPFYFLCNKIIGRVWTVLKPGEFGNYNSKVLEIMRRLFLGLFVAPCVFVATLVCSPLALVPNFIGDRLLGKRPYLCLAGTYVGEKKETCATFNMGTLLPPMTLIDGVEDSSERLKAIADQLHDFHFVCGQEVDGASARFFARELKKHFKEFYTYLGKSNIPYLPSGLFLACKEEVLNVTVVPFTGDVQKTIKRELVIFELQDYCIATMHLDGGNSPQTVQTHLEEIQQARDAIFKDCRKPTILCGDFNEDRYNPSKAYQTLIGDFVDCIKEVPGEILTCTNKLEIKRFGKTAPITQESIDYITYNKNQKSLKVEFTKASYTFDLSDHHLVSGKITYKA